MATDLDAIASLTGAAITEAQAKTWFTNMRAALAEMGDPMGTPGRLQNLSLSLTVGASALTIALKDRDGSDPSAASPVSAGLRNVTAATGDFTVQNAAAASSLVVSSGSALGTVSNVPFRLWIALFHDGGTTLRLGVINCLSTAAGAGAGRDVTAIYPLAAWGIASSTAEGGAGAADSAQTFYTGTAVTSKAFVVLGYAEWPSGLATAGTWSSGPSRIQLFGPGVPLPGQVVQVARNDTGAVATGTTIIPYDDTIPQKTEGDQYLSQAITPLSAANALEIEWLAVLTSSVSGNLMASALFQDTTANALAAVANTPNAGQASAAHRGSKKILAATTSSTTLKLRAGQDQAGTTTFNGLAGARKYGGILNSFLSVAEVMA